MSERVITPDSVIRHRHADGTEHEHAGSHGFTIGGQVRADDYGDEPGHSHTTLSLSGDTARRPSTGIVVWSERGEDIESPHVEGLTVAANAAAAERCPGCGAVDPMGDEAAWHADTCPVIRLETVAVQLAAAALPWTTSPHVTCLGGNVIGVEAVTRDTEVLVTDDDTQPDRYTVTCCAHPDDDDHDHDDDPTATGLPVDALAYVIAALT